MIEICSHPIHLIHKGNTGNFIFICLTPYGLTLRLHPTYSTKDYNSTIKNAKRSLNLSGKINMSRRIDDINSVIIPECCRCSGRDCNSSFFLLLHPVHSGSTLMNFTHPVNTTGVIKYAFGSCSLTGINVCQNADISNSI